MHFLFSTHFFKKMDSVEDIDIINDYIPILSNAVEHWKVDQFHPLGEPEHVVIIRSKQDVMSNLTSTNYQFRIRCDFINTPSHMTAVGSVRSASSSSSLPTSSSPQSTYRNLYVFHEKLFAAKKSADLFGHYTNLIKNKYPQVVFQPSDICIVVHRNTETNKFSQNDPSRIPEIHPNAMTNLKKVTSVPYFVFIDPTLVPSFSFVDITILKHCVANDGYDFEQVSSLIHSKLFSRDLFDSIKYAQPDAKYVHVAYLKVKPGVVEQLYNTFPKKCVHDPGTNLFLCEPGNICIENVPSKTAGYTPYLNIYEGEHI